MRNQGGERGGRLIVAYLRNAISGPLPPTPSEMCGENPHLALSESWALTQRVEAALYPDFTVFDWYQIPCEKVNHKF